VVSFDFIQIRIEELFQKNSKQKSEKKKKDNRKEKNKRKTPAAHLGRTQEASRPSSPRASPTQLPPPSLSLTDRPVPPVIPLPEIPSPSQ
jgi:hypothetical protein